METAIGSAFGSSGVGQASTATAHPEAKIVSERHPLTITDFNTPPRQPVADLSFSHSASSSSGAGMESPRIHVSAKELTVGIENGALGWIQVKATSEGGQISASIHAQTAESALALSNHLPSLSAFLAGREVPLHDLQVGHDHSGQPGGGAQRDGGQAERPGPGTEEPQSGRQQASIADANPASLISVRV